MAKFHAFKQKFLKKLLCLQDALRAIVSEIEPKSYGAFEKRTTDEIPFQSHVVHCEI